MLEVNFDEVVQRIVVGDPRYHPDSYGFLREALDFTQKQIGRENHGRVRHVTGQELLQGIREFALAQFGPMARTVLEEWGVHSCADFGEMVFNMVESGLLSKTDKDSRVDFQDGYDFTEAFCRPYWPQNRQIPSAKPASDR